MYGSRETRDIKEAAIVLARFIISQAVADDHLKRRPNKPIPDICGHPSACDLQDCVLHDLP